MDIQMNNGTIIIDGKVYSGNNVNMINGKIVIDGKEVTSPDEKPGVKIVYKPITIEIRGNVSSVTNNSGDIIVHGNAGDIKVTSGDVEVDGSAKSVTTVSGDVRVGGQVHGDVRTVSGKIIKK